MRIAFTAPLFLALVLAACGGDSNDAAAPTATTMPPAEIPIVDITFAAVTGSSEPEPASTP